MQAGDNGTPTGVENGEAIPEPPRVILESHSSSERLQSILVIVLVFLVAFGQYRQWRSDLRADRRGETIKNDSEIIKALSETVDAFRQLATATTPEERAAAQQRLRDLENQAEENKRKLVPNATTQDTRPSGTTRTTNSNNRTTSPGSSQPASPPTSQPSRAPPPTQPPSSTSSTVPVLGIPIPTLPCIGVVCPRTRSIWQKS